MLSDSWDDRGFPGVSVDESGPDGDLNPYYHSSQDTIDKLDFEKAKEYVKVSALVPVRNPCPSLMRLQLVLAFAVELAQ